MSTDYRSVPEVIRWDVNFAVLFQLSDYEVRRFHTDQIFGISLDVFEDMCEFVWGDSNSDYLVVDMTKWLYMKNLRYAVNVATQV